MMLPENEYADEFTKFCEDRDRAARRRISEHLKAPTYRDEVRSNLLRRMESFPGEGHMPGILRVAIVDFLLDEVMEAVDHACQMARIERGVLPYDED